MSRVTNSAKCYVAEVEGTITEYNRPTIDYDYPLFYPILDSGYCIGYYQNARRRRSDPCRRCFNVVVIVVNIVVVARAGNSRNRILTIHREMSGIDKRNMSGQANDFP
jgi:hypothetical protein